METQDNETYKGWPLGLEIMNMRLRLTETLHAAARVEPYSLRIPSPSFSSLSSSYLDTESTASFFQDHSVSLGRLIGIKPRERDADIPRKVDRKGGVCIPLLCFNTAKDESK